MQYTGKYEIMMQAKEMHNAIKFVHDYIEFCAALNLVPTNDAVGLLDDGTSDHEKQNIMAQILIDIQNKLKE